MTTVTLWALKRVFTMHYLLNHNGPITFRTAVLNRRLVQQVFAFRVVVTGKKLLSIFVGALDQVPLMATWAIQLCIIFFFNGFYMMAGWEICTAYKQTKSTFFDRQGFATFRAMGAFDLFNLTGFRFMQRFGELAGGIIGTTDKRT